MIVAKDERIVKPGEAQKHQPTVKPSSCEGRDVRN
jgi:hypothetical protein